MAVLAVAACSGSSNSGDDSNGFVDSGTDATTIQDAGPPRDAGVDSGPPCTATPCVLAIAAGSTHTCALLADKTVRCWGGNASGESGQPGTRDAGIYYPNANIPPTAVAGITDALVIASGGFMGSLDVTCVLDSTGTPQCWGSDQFGQRGEGVLDGSANGPDLTFAKVTGVTSFGSGAAHECVVLNGGSVSCWGSDFFQELGRSIDGGSDPSPGLVPVPTGVTFTQMSGGYEHTCGTTTDNHAWCWGMNGENQLGRLNTDGGLQDIAPAVVANLDNVKAVTAGYASTCALTTDGTAKCWGLNASDSLGRNTADAGDASVALDANPQSVVMPAGIAFSQITAFIEGYCALATDGSVWCWGYNGHGDTAQGALNDAGVTLETDIPVPSKVPSLAGATQLASTAGGFHVCARINDGSVECWGTNQFGQLGSAVPDGGAIVQLAPTRVTF